MRRQELSIENPEEINAVLNACTWGTLSLQTDDEWPYSVPMNFALSQGKIGLHCALQGKRIELLNSHMQVQFTVVREYSFLPSYALGGELACPATQLFQSVMLWGNVHRVEDLQRKAEILQALMDKMQPEGQHKRMDSNSSDYASSLRSVGVLEIEPIRISGKFKFGQNLNAEKVDLLIAFLEKRSFAQDLETVSLIRKYRPA